jgi:hypothetical protein
MVDTHEHTVIENSLRFDMTEIMVQIDSKRRILRPFICESLGQPAADLLGVLEMRVGGIRRVVPGIRAGGGNGA